MNSYYYYPQQQQHQQNSQFTTTMSCCIPAELTCSVCSDRAEGYHFGAISCAACGAFFRRSISDQKTYFCSTKTCSTEIDPSKRGGTCRFCRFLKCINSGMLTREVRAKRVDSFTASYSLIRSFPSFVSNLIEQMSNIRRDMQLHRQSYENPCPSSGLSPLFHSIHSEFRIFETVYPNHCMLQNIGLCQKVKDEYIMILHQKSLIHDLFLKSYIFETCLSTCFKGGVQLDRLIFPNMMFIESRDIRSSRSGPIISANQLNNCSTLFSFLVRVISKSLQSFKLDQNYLSIIHFIFLTDGGHNLHPHDEVKWIRQNLIAEINRIAGIVPNVSEIWNINQQLLHGFQSFQMLLQGFEPSRFFV